MKKIGLFLMFCFWSFDSRAQMPYIEEVRALGAIAGQGMACGSPKYDTFELLARAILLTKAPSNKLKVDAMYAYNEEKANAYFSKEMDGFYECVSINERFEKQDIFRAVLYADGTLKMPDGQVISPRIAYDATQIYKKNDKELDDAKAIYKGTGEAKILKVDVKDMPRNAQEKPQVPLEPTVKHIKRKY